MQPASKILVPLLAYKSAADRELLEFASQWGPAPEEPLRQVLRHLDHVSAVDRIFKCHLAGIAHGLAATLIEEQPVLARLRERIREVDAWFEEYARHVSSPELSRPIRFMFTDGQRGTMTPVEMLLHVCTHAAYHRGAAWAVFRSAARTPASLTFAGFLHGTSPERREQETLPR